MRNHFFISYAGNKRNEVNRIYDEIDFKGVENIVEPYCGSCAVSYNIWTLQKDKNFKYVLNDADNNLINIMKKVINDDYKKLEDEVNELRLHILKLSSEKGYDVAKEYYKDISNNKNNTDAGYLLVNRYNKLRVGIFPTPDTLKTFQKEFKFSNYPIFEFLRTANIEIHNTDGDSIINLYNKSDSFIFLDPPYMASCNNFYKRGADSDLKMCYYPLYKRGLKNYSAKIILCHELNWMFEVLFEEYIDKNKQYDKRYENNLGGNYSNKPATKHVCIKNY